MAGTEAQICLVGGEFSCLSWCVPLRGVTYDANVQLKCADDDDDVCIPCQVASGIRERDVKHIGPHGACCCDEETTCEQADNDNLLLPWKPQPDYVRDWEYDNEEVGCGVDASSGQQVQLFVDTLLRDKGKRPIV